MLHFSVKTFSQTNSNRGLIRRLEEPEKAGDSISNTRTPRFNNNSFKKFVDTYRYLFAE